MTLSATLAFASVHALTILSWIIRLGAFVVVPFRRSAAEARTWLLGFFIAPIPTLIIYLAIGRPEHSKKRKALFAKLPKVIGNIAKRANINPDQLRSDLPEKYLATASLIEGVSQIPPVGGNAVELLPNYDDAIARIIADIDDAKHHVHLAFYIFAYDETGRKVISALERAGQRGVVCRVLIDAMGSHSSARKVEKKLKKVGIEVHRILPLTRRLNSSRIDLRNHRKIVVIDGNTGYTGSQNIVNAAINDRLSNDELLCRVQGPVVSGFQLVFLGDWYLETEEDIEDGTLFSDLRNCGKVTAQVLPSGPDYKGSSVDMIFTDLIHQARDEIVLVTPYFIPNEAMVSAITTASLRGVDTTLILSKESDSALVGLAQRSYYTRLLEAGVAIHLYEADFLHAKHMRIDDDICVIGSSNMDMRSFELNAEVSLICYGNKTANDLKIIENKYLDESVIVDLKSWKERSLPKKILENSARMLSDLL
ncbi:MAG: cardiolipin synthase [Sphingopyxis sp.]|nr:MAG: cardiolipin synthase [Sphingopyxis sp.]